MLFSLSTFHYHCHDPTIPMTSQTPLVIVYPSRPRYPPQVRKSTQSPNVVCCFYSYSFASLLTIIHNLSESSSYRDIVLNSLWQPAMQEELSTLYETTTWDLMSLLPRKKSLALGGSIQFKESWMSLLSITKLVYSLKDSLRNMF